MTPLDSLGTGLAGHEPDLFNSAGYAGLHAPSVQVEWPGTAVFRATPLRRNLFRSPGRAPYGGFDVDPRLDDPGYTAFVAACEAALRQAGGAGLEVGLPPLCYRADLPRRLVSLSRLGYRVIRQELNQAIPIATATFRRGARKTLLKAARAGLDVRLLRPHEHQAAYDVIAENRRKKGRTLSMTFQDVQAMLRCFPVQIHIFGARLDHRTIAAAIAIAPNPSVLYVYAWGEVRGAEPLSPVTALADELRRFAAARGFTTLDLGTSSVDGIVDPGLLAFKRSLGAETGLKLWLGKALP